MSKVLVLASGGLDSTCLLYKAVSEYGASNVFALNMYYRQKHHKEMECFQWQMEHLGIENYRVLDLSSIFAGYMGCTLLEGGGDIPHGSYAEQKDITTYVPFRNGVLLAIATSIAEQEGCTSIWYGAHRDDMTGEAYPDCSRRFLVAINQAAQYGTKAGIQIGAPWIACNKTEVVAKGLEYGMTQEDFEHTWSCYEGGDKPCGQCGTCIDRKVALEANGLKNC